MNLHFLAALVLGITGTSFTGSIPYNATYTRWTPSIVICILLMLLPFNSLFSRTTWVSWYQKGKLDFNETRDDGDEKKIKDSWKS